MTRHASVCAALLLVGCGTPPSLRLPGDDVSRGARPDALTLLSMPSQTVVPLSQLRGRTTVVEFWATWCGPCKEALPAYAELAAEYDPHRLTFIPISVDDDPNAVAPFLTTLGLELPALVDANGTVRRALGVERIPTTIVFTDDEHVHLRHEGWDSETPDTVSRWIAANAR